MNILLAALILVAIWRAVTGFKRGMVKELISMVGLIFAAMIGFLAVNALQGYAQSNFFEVIVCVVLIGIVAVVHSVLKLLFFSAKVVSSLPVVSTVNQLCGVVFGLLEAIVMYWILCYALVNLDMGLAGSYLRVMIRENTVLYTLYQYNIIGALVDNLWASITM
ncbi:MAG: CvpA family protein [Lachnospiraceae bacterium]|nr:CvpA family protein [Lachnospiraceae bacterium]